MATWNGAKHVAQQLQSIAEQTRRPDELIVCDDGSTDETVSLVRRFTASAPFPVHLHVNPTNLGLHQNFARALSLASNDVIFPCDQDDVWHANKLDQYMSVFEMNPRIGLVFGDANIVDEDLAPRGYTAWDTVHFTTQMRQRVRQGAAFEVLLRHCFVAGALLAVRESLKPIILPVPASWPFDAWVAMVAAGCADATIVSDPVNDYRQHGGQSIGTRRKGLWTRYREAQGVTIKYYETMARAHRDLRDRLLERSALGANDDKLIKLENKIRFAEARVSMRQSRWRRAPVIARQWWAGNYTRFGQGLRSLAMDIFL
jgi:glycosyltransferase involved in cell wall biosynthesis